MNNSEEWLPFSDDEVARSLDRMDPQRVETAFAACNDLLQRECDRREGVQAKAAVWLGVTTALAPVWVAVVGLLIPSSQLPLWSLVVVVAVSLFGLALFVNSACKTRKCLQVKVVNSLDPNYLWQNPAAPNRQIQGELAASAYKAAMLLSEANNSMVDDLRCAQTHAFCGALLLLVVAGSVLLYVAAERLLQMVGTCP